MAYSNLPIKERLLAKAEWAGTCLLWTGAMHPRGYGTIRKDGKWKKAYRVSYEVHHGPIPSGMVVMHSCDCPRCINPAHLSLGTQLENVRDMFSKGRENKAIGSRNAKTKMTAAQVAEVRARYIPGKYRHGAGALASEYGISKPSMRAILTGKVHKL